VLKNPALCPGTGRMLAMSSDKEEFHCPACRKRLGPGTRGHRTATIEVPPHPKKEPR